MTDVPMDLTKFPTEPPATLRDMFAAAALVGFAGRVTPSTATAQRMWHWADLMLAERDVRS